MLQALKSRLQKFISRLVIHKIMTRCLLQICSLFRGGNLAIWLASEMKTVEESGSGVLSVPRKWPRVRQQALNPLDLFVY